MLSHKRVLAAIAVIAIISVSVSGWWLGSPPFINETVVEEPRFAASAVLPSDITHVKVEQSLTGITEVDSTINQVARYALVGPSTLFDGCEVYSRAEPTPIPTVFPEIQLILSPFRIPENPKTCPIPLAISDPNQETII